MGSDKVKKEDLRRVLILRCRGGLPGLVDSAPIAGPTPQTPLLADECENIYLSRIKPPSLSPHAALNEP